MTQTFSSDINKLAVKLNHTIINMATIFESHVNNAQLLKTVIFPT
jgi:hypothetical protein